MPHNPGHLVTEKGGEQKTHDAWVLQGHRSQGVSAETQELGERGEAFAGRWLERKGWRIEARNVRFGTHGELDLVATQQQLSRWGKPHVVWVFVEVKTRRSDQAYGEQSVTRAKRRRIVGLAWRWLRAQGHEQVSVRFDVIALGFDPGCAGVWEVHHLEGAFDGEGECI